MERIGGLKGAPALGRIRCAQLGRPINEAEIWETRGSEILIITPLGDHLGPPGPDLVDLKQIGQQVAGQRHLARARNLLAGVAGKRSTTANGNKDQQTN